MRHNIGFIVGLIGLLALTIGSVFREQPEDSRGWVPKETVGMKYGRMSDLYELRLWRCWWVS